MHAAEIDFSSRRATRELVKTVYDPTQAELSWKLEELLGRELRYYSYGRFALSAALKCAGVGPGDAVLFPELICRDALYAVNSLGGKAIFYPVSDGLGLGCDWEDLPKAKAVVFVDYFGFPQDERPFRKYSARSGAWLIEDNAHGLFSLDGKGRWLGLRGDMGIFSIRKSVSLPNGAALVSTGGPPLPKAIAHRAAPGTWLSLKKGFRRSVSPLGVSPLRAVVGTRRKLKRLLRREEFPNSGPESEKTFEQLPNPCEELSRPVTLVDPKKEILRRRELYRFCERIVMRSGGRSVFPRLNDGVSPYVYPFYAEGTFLKKSRAALNREGLDTYPWPDLPGAVAPKAPRHYKSLWCVNFLW